MEKFKIILEDGSQKEVYSLFYLYNSKYYFIYTEKELDENGYVILYVVQIGKEVNNTPNGPVDTGYMIGVDINNAEESNSVQASITKIVEDKKNGTSSPDINYLPLNMLTNLKIVSKKTFRLLKSIVEQYFDIMFDEQNTSSTATFGQIKMSNNDVISSTSQSSLNSMALNGSVDNLIGEAQPSIKSNISVSSTPQGNFESNLGINTNPQNSDVIIDYRAKFFEAQQKCSDLEKKVQELTDMLSKIKQIVE